MDKIQLLQERKAKIVEGSKEIRGRIEAIVDENSFVELSAFSFSKNEFYGEDVSGEGFMPEALRGTPIGVSEIP